MESLIFPSFFGERAKMERLEGIFACEPKRNPAARASARKPKQKNFLLEEKKWTDKKIKNVEKIFCEVNRLKPNVWPF